jgi:hypothetical protein
MNTKKYRALISQNSIANPEVTVLEDGIVGILWVRESQGHYSGKKSAAFPAEKTFLMCNAGSTVDGWQEPGMLVTLYRQDNDTLILVTQDKDGNLSDGELSNTPVEVVVYG